MHPKTGLGFKFRVQDGLKGASLPRSLIADYCCRRCFEHHQQLAHGRACMPLNQQTES